MAKGHPVDAAGLVLPHPWWPDDRQAPGELEFVRRFLNSVNRENGAERFRTADDLDRWLVTEGAPVVDATDTQLTCLLALRDALLALVLDNARNQYDPAGRNAARSSAARWSTVTELARHITIGVEGHEAGLALRPRGTPFESLIGRIVMAIVAAQADGTWLRLKSCQHCRWVVFDPSKNRSSRWCSMSACGGRHNARQYRQRQRSAGAVE